VLLDEVLIGELLTIDGFATSSVSAGEVTSLEHELGDDTVEGRVGVAETLLTSAQSSEVLSGSGSYIIVEVEEDTTGLLLNLGSCLSTGVKDWALPGYIEVGLDSHFVGRLTEATYGVCIWFGGGVFDGKRILEKRSC